MRDGLFGWGGGDGLGLVIMSSVAEDLRVYIYTVNPWLTLLSTLHCYMRKVFTLKCEV